MNLDINFSMGNFDASMIEKCSNELQQNLSLVLNQQEKLGESNSVIRRLKSIISSSSPRCPRMPITDILSKRDNSLKMISSLLKCFLDLSVKGTTTIRRIPKVLKKKEEGRKIAAVVLKAFEILVGCKRYTIKFENERKPIEDVLEFISNQAWFKENCKELNEHWINVTKQSKVERQRYFEILKNNTFECQIAENYDRKFENHIFLLNLIHTMNSHLTPKEHEQFNIISPKNFLNSYSLLVKEYNVFAQIKKSIYDEKLPLEQKRILINFCKKWLSVKRNIELFLNEDILGEIRQILNFKKNNQNDKSNSKLAEDHLFEEEMSELEKVFKEAETFENCNSETEAYRYTSSDVIVPFPIPNNFEDSKFNKYVERYQKEFLSITSRSFIDIDPQEFLDCKTRKIEYFFQNLQNAIRVFNAITGHVATTTLQDQTSIEQVNLRFNFFSKVGLKCYEENDFNSAYAIYLGLCNTEIERIVRDYPQAAFYKLSQKMNIEHNFANFRKAIKAVEGKPMIPPLVICLKDVEFLIAGNAFNRVEHFNSVSVIIKNIKQQQDLIRKMILSPPTHHQKMILSSPSIHSLYPKLVERGSLLKPKETHSEPSSTKSSPMLKARSLGHLGGIRRFNRVED